MKGNFEVTGLGKCLVGTYAIRNLTKHFACTPQDLLFLPTKDGYDLEFTSYMLKFCNENAQIQAQGAAGLKVKAVEDIDMFLDENTISGEQYSKMYDALWLSIAGMTATEFMEKNKSKAPEPEEEKKSLTTLTTGENLTSTLGGQPLDPNSLTA